MVGSRLVGSGVSGLVLGVVSLTFVFNISNISSVGISNRVGHNLGTAIGKSDTVFTVGGISITVFVGLEVSVCVVIIDSISVFIDCWSFFVYWSLSVSWSWSMVSWGMYYWLVNNWGYVWSWSMYYWLVYNWGDIWSWLVNWGWVVNWGWFVSWSWVINWSRFVYWCWVVWGWFVNWNMSRSMNGSTIFFSSIWVVYVLWSGMGLARYGSMVSSMGLMDSNFDGWGVAVLDNLMTALVSQSNSQKSRYCDECLIHR